MKGASTTRCRGGQLRVQTGPNAPSRPQRDAVEGADFVQKLVGAACGSALNRSCQRWVGVHFAMAHGGTPSWRRRPMHGRAAEPDRFAALRSTRPGAHTDAGVREGENLWGRACRETSCGCDQLGAARRPGLRCRVCRAHQGTLHFTDPTGTVHARRSKNCNPKLLHCAKAHVKPGRSAPSHLRLAPLKCDWTVQVASRALGQRLTKRGRGARPLTCRPPTTAVTSSETFDRPVENPQALLMESYP